MYIYLYNDDSRIGDEAVCYYTTHQTIPLTSVWTDTLITVSITR